MNQFGEDFVLAAELALEELDAAFADAMADGIIEKHELELQQTVLVETMRTVEGLLSDAQHAAVTRLLVELSAYNVMRTVHELEAGRLRRSLAV